MRAARNRKRHRDVPGRKRVSIWRFHTPAKKKKRRRSRNRFRETYHTRCFAYQAALQEKGAGKALFDRAVADLGGLDLLVNNAGLTIFESLQEIKEETLDLLINLDFKNYILMMREAANYMIASGTKGRPYQYYILARRTVLSGGWPVRRSEGRIRIVPSVLLRWMCLNTAYASTTSRRARMRIRTREELIEGGNVAMADFMRMSLETRCCAWSRWTYRRSIGPRSRISTLRIKHRISRARRSAWTAA